MINARRLFLILILTLSFLLTDICAAGFNPVQRKVDDGPAKGESVEEAVQEEEPDIIKTVTAPKLKPVKIGGALINSPKYKVGEYESKFDPATVGSVWEKKTIDEKTCYVSPVIYAGRGVELNHHEVTIEYSGDGRMLAGMVYYTRRDIEKAMEQGYNFSGMKEIKSGEPMKFVYSHGGATYAWLILRPEGAVRVQSIKHKCLTVKNGIYGHIPREYRFGGGSLPYRIMYPKNYDPNKKYPLVISVHGSGGCGIGNRKSMEPWNLARYLYTKYYDNENMECFSIVPQIPDIKVNPIPAPYFPNGDKGRPSLSNSYPQLAAVNEQGWYVQASIALIKEMVDSDELSIDPARVYYTGFSFGGGACWEFLKAAPDLFAGAISVAGWFVGLPYQAPSPEEMDQLKIDVARFKDIPVRIHVGGADPMKLAAKPGHEEILRQGGTSLYFEYPEAKHTAAGDKTWNDANTVIWLFSQRKTQ